MNRRSFFKSLASAVAAAAVEVCGLREDVAAMVQSVAPPTTLKFTAYESIGVTVANTKAITKINFS